MDNNMQRDTQSDYDEVDYKICGELGKQNLCYNMVKIEEKNRALDEFVNNQTPDGVI